MKIIYTNIITLLFSTGAVAQFQPDSVLINLTFEDTTVINKVFYTDSIIDSLGIWQIGVPNKPIFDSAYSPPNAIVTSLDSAISPNTKASFIITLPTVNNLRAGMLTFTHKYDFDSGHSGGYVEFSVDTGIHWHPVNRICAGQIGYSEGFCAVAWCGPVFVDGQDIDPPTWWGTVPVDTTAQGIPYFTGMDSTWIVDTIAMPVLIGLKTNYITQFLFRFTAFTDSTTTAYHAGWMIDNINYLQNVICIGGGINEINSSHLRLYPDPATDGFTLTVSDENSSDYVLVLYDLTGCAILKEDFSGQQVELHRGNIAAGAYFIQVTNKATQSTLQKRVVFE